MNYQIQTSFEIHFFGDEFMERGIGTGVCFF